MKMDKKVNPGARRAYVGQFANWVKKCNYVESADRTQAAIDIYIEGITGGNTLSLSEAVGCDYIDKGLAAEVAMKVARRFCDSVSIEGEPEFRLESFKDLNGDEARRLVIKADIRLAESGDSEGWLCNTDGRLSIN